MTTSTVLPPEAAQETRKEKKPPPPPPASREDLIKRIQREAQIGRVDAHRFLKWLEALARSAERRQVYTHLLTFNDISTKHPILEKLIPDNVRSREGSTHRALEEHLADGRGVVELLHGKTGQGRATYCKVDVVVFAVWV